MTPEEHVKGLEARGYAFCGIHRDTRVNPDYRLAIGDRVQNKNQRLWYRTANGTIESIYYRERPTGAQTYASDDVELIVKNDDGSYSFVASHHVNKVG